MPPKVVTPGPDAQPLASWPSDVRTRRYGLLPGPWFAPLEDIGEQLPVPPKNQQISRHYMRDRVTHQPHEFHWLFGHWPTLDPTRLLDHYTPIATLAAMARNGSLRLGPLHRMNDPRETEPWALQVMYTPNFSMTGAVTELKTRANESPPAHETHLLRLG
jgi:hypothetical protein